MCSKIRVFPCRYRQKEVSFPQNRIANCRDPIFIQKLSLMICPSRLSLTLLVAGASALSALSLNAFTPDDPFYPRQWQWNPVRNGINISGAWSSGWTGEGVVIGIIDQWVDPMHEDLAANYNAELSRDFVNETFNTGEMVYPDETHGTLVAGMAAAVGGNGIGVTGAAPKAQIAGLHINFSDGQIFEALALHSGVKEDGTYVSDAAVRILNLSLGESAGAYFSGMLESDQTAFLKASTRNNVIHVLAGGNERSDPTNPNANGCSLQAFEGGIVVGATNDKGKYASFSSYGSNLFVTAPGQNVLSTTRSEATPEEEEEEGDDPDNAELDVSSNPNYEYWNGTSASSPIVAGVVALAAQANVAMDARWAKHALVDSCDVLESMKIYKKDEKTGDSTKEVENWSVNSAGKWFSNDYGFGLINADKFVVNAANIAYTTIRTTVSTEAVAEAGATVWVNPADENDKTRSPLKKFIAEDVSVTQAIESVEVTVDIAGIDVDRDLKIEIVAPDGTRSVVMQEWDDSELDIPGEDEDGNPQSFVWTFVSNAFWGTSAEKASGDWKIEFTNGSGTVGTVNAASLKFNTGEAVLESNTAKMRVQAAKAENDYEAEVLNVHALVLDTGATFTIEGAISNTSEAGKLCVEDSVILNKGTLDVSGTLTSYDANWKGVKIYLNGGTINLNEKGIVEAARGVDVSGGTLNLFGGALSGGTLKIAGGSVVAQQKTSSISSIELSGGRLATNADAVLNVSNFRMTGGVFDMGGTNDFELQATGGDIVVAEKAVVTSATLGASYEEKEVQKTDEKGGLVLDENGVPETEIEVIRTSAALLVKEGATLALGSEFSGGIGLGELLLEGYYADAVFDDVGKEISAEKIVRANAQIRVGGVVKAGSISAKTANISAQDATFTGSLAVDRKSVLSLSGTVKIAGASGLSVAGSSVFNTAAGTVIETSNVVVGGESSFVIGGATDGGVTTIVASPLPGIPGLKCTNSSIVLVSGNSLKTNENVVIEDNSVIELSFTDKLPTDTITFIELSDPTRKSVTVDNSVSVKLDSQSVPTLWNGTEDIPLAYNIDTRGTISADLPEGVELVPLRLTYNQMSGEEIAIAKSLRTCLSDGENTGTSKQLIDEINKIESLSALTATYHEFLPVNLITINSLNNKQANATTGALERRSRELRSGYPVSDVWASPLFNSYGFSFSANPNLVASSGMRQFVGYDLNDNRAMLWANGGHSFSDGDAVGYTSKTETSMTNASIGFDYAISNDFAVGLFLGYSGGKTEMKASGSETEASMRSVGVYFAGSKNDKEGSCYYMGMLSYGMGEYDFTRTSEVGAYRSQASASPDGSQAIGYLAFGYEWDAGSQALSYQWTTGPTASLRYTYNSVDGYTESGNGADTLCVDDYNYDSLLSSLGWRTTVRFNVQEWITFVPEARISWQHEFLDGDEDIDATLAIPGATPFSTVMNKEGADYVTAGIGVTVLIAESTTVALDYDVNFLREDSDPEHNINLMVRCRF